MKYIFVGDMACLLSYCAHVTARNKNTIGVASEEGRSGISRWRSHTKDKLFTEVQCSCSWKCLLTLRFGQEDTVLPFVGAVVDSYGSKW